MPFTKSRPDVARSRFDPRRLTDGLPVFPLMILFGLNAVDELDRAAFNVLTPEIRDAFRLDVQGVLTLQALIIPVAVLFSQPIGFLADRYRRTRMAAAGAAVWGGFSVLTGLAANLWWLGVARAGAGLGKTVNDPTHNSLLADYYPVRTRARVYYAHRLANSVGLFVGPLVAGFLATLFSWRLPFIVLAIPTFALVMLAFRLHEPKRGVYDRRELDVDDQLADNEEEPPAWQEAWRLLYSVRFLRRIYFALPFLAVSTLGIQSLLALFYEEFYGLNAAQRGVIFALDEPFNVVGLIIGAIVVQRLLVRNATIAVYAVGAAAAGVAVAIAGIALSPHLFVAVGAGWIRSLIGALLVPGIITLLSVTIPPRARSLGYASMSLWLLPGVLILPMVGALSDEFGTRAGLLLLLPVFLIGAGVVASGGAFVEADIHRVRSSSLAQAEALRSRREGKAKMLIVRSLDVSYSGVQVLFNVDFEVDDGEIIALLGANGSGKSTLLRAISGLVQPSAGAVVFDGRDITSADPVRTAALGISVVPGGGGIFPEITVAENLRTAGWLYRSDPEYRERAVRRVTEYFPILSERWELPAGSLSGGEQQMLSLGMAFIAKPKLLLIDELSLGLAPTIVDQLLRIVREIHAGGTTIVLVEQSVNTALKLAERAVFMEKGEVRFAGRTKDLLKRPDVLRAVYLEGSAAAFADGNRGSRRDRGAKATGYRRNAGAHSRKLRTARPVLRAQQLTKRYGGVTAVNHVDIEVREREILGLIGPNGAGKTTVLDLISGFVPVDGGRIWLAGTDITPLAAHERARAGLGRSFQDSRLWPSLTVREALSVSFEREVEISGALPAAFGLASVARSEAQIFELVEELIDLLGLAAFRDKFTSELSTGSRRIVEIAATIAQRPAILLLDEPSSGIAQKETEQLGPFLRQVRDYLDCSLLVIEHDMPLITNLADRIVAFDLGAVVADGAPEEVIRHPKVVESYLGGMAAEVQGGRRRRPARKSSQGSRVRR